ncbi:bifunctional proline dehydrogenase/L-glutamate gamma-semialdehyde dehydrogenase PutA [Rhodobacteraceae bacterium RKSG542]|uniref:bifunctional proline dehydrogenase/L-glutamate gamma-semialdehyde dehydrogenase PutA n=1 Tax=Pseudovibrio flavus TaxID=2529854 RepID=UPI0012BD7687|nr:bifunctional proline dehydrogenase/L-glutamate gamma-semialdehyde dehydrogenase PutA [Pseudovibrio flavus]MTI16324.1 bifunctional proline dehydrogenase/L-glutamate gamma-semialdehyde dehydrogenase PutA [Pseudovibrio flavus]
MKSAESLETLRTDIREAYLANEADKVRQLANSLDLTTEAREQISARAEDLVKELRTNTSPTIMESFLGEYGLSTKEGVALMCLAEALLRVPDTQTIDELIADKITPSKWSEHLGHSSSTLVNASTWALMLTGKVLEPEREGLTSTLKGMVKRLGEPVVRTAVAQAMKELGRQFVLGRTIEEAQENAKKEEAKGYTYSYDMLGEAALTDKDAKHYHLAYSKAISSIATYATHATSHANPGISVKLSALHPRYEFAKKERVLKELVPRVLSLMQLARSCNIGFNIDAEEADRLDISLDVIGALMADPALEGWEGFGIVVQAFTPRASHVIDWLYAMAQKYDRKIMARLVKGAYWDTEIKRAQTMGLDGYPVFTRKNNTDISYLACAHKLLQMTDRIYPQFATHNAHSVASVLQMAEGLPKDAYEFQRLHGMGEALHDMVLTGNDTRCRIYAPVGAHRDLLAYLVRRLLENGANSSFVNQIRNEAIDPAIIAHDPLVELEQLGDAVSNERIPAPLGIYGPERKNAKGWDLSDPIEQAAYLGDLSRWDKHEWEARPLIAGTVKGTEPEAVFNPASHEDKVGTLVNAQVEDLYTALAAATANASEWSSLSTAQRAVVLNRIADLYEENAGELFTLLTREAGKTYNDAIGELREAVDFARYYANEIQRLEAEGRPTEARGIIACISPWNFPLAIFSGQIMASLAAGNAVIAKPAAQTPLVAARAIALMHEAGVPASALQYVPGAGSTIGAAMSADPRVSGITFTGSTPTAMHINRSIADNLSPEASFIAETGGLNAMIVDSTALPEQAVKDIVASSFQSAGQRCSALRMLYVQEDVFEPFLEMLQGAMDELELGDPRALSVDVGPVIDEASRNKIMAHCQQWADKGRLVKQLEAPETGFFVPPTLIHLNGIEELEEEIFGPVLHIAPYKAKNIDRVIDAINAKGFGLTFGLHTRIDQRVQHIVDRVDAGNLYVNRNQIGAIVGSQPFGGEGLSGTGPKAGGPNYVARLLKPQLVACSDPTSVEAVGSTSLQQSINALNNSKWQQNKERFTKLSEAFPNHAKQIEVIEAEGSRLMPGPTGESNRLFSAPRGVILCLGPTPEALEEQAIMALAAGNAVVLIAPHASVLAAKLDALGTPVTAFDASLSATSLSKLDSFTAIASGHDIKTMKGFRKALAEREGALIPIICEVCQPERYMLERHLCVDTTAAGGNASLLAQAEG